jgi:ABC-type multidrug transport system ATPase subunit
MSEPILKALIRLFALISDIHDDTEISGKSKDIVRLFLLRHLNNEMVAKYMILFDEYLIQFHPENITRGSLKERKRTSLTAMKVLAICENINEELKQSQKVYVIVQLMDFISFSAEITENELEFLETISTAFNIPAQEYRNIRSFILGNTGEVPEKNRIMIVDNSDENKQPGIKHLFVENLDGRIRFLHIVSTNNLLLRYSGDDDLFLNGQNLFPDQTFIFDRGSSIRGSGINTIYYNDIAGVFIGETFKQKVSFDAVDICLRFLNSENGIHNLSFHEESGKLVGVMGGSGVGKTTLLNVLSGITSPGSGEVFINGYRLYSEKDREHLKGVIGFVPQDDLLIEDLTVYQNLYYNARMCLDNLSEDKLAEAIDRILIGFDLDGIRDLKVGNPLNKIISGGQRKRLNIALELIREPTVLFIDEPTSGLSSVDSETVMTLLKEQAYRGKLVIINIHQPASDIYKMFDKIMIIDKGGYMIFYGNPTEAIIYFKTRASYANANEDQCITCGNINADQLLQIVEAKVMNEHGKPTHIRKVTPKEWAEKFSEETGNVNRNINPLKEKLPENYYSIPGLIKQSVVFFSRDVLSKLANRQYILISLFGAPLLALILAYFTKDVAGTTYLFSENENLPAYMFMCVITSLFMGLVISAEEIVKDRKILKRESFLNLSWFSYLNSKISLMFLISAIQAIFFILIGNFILEIRGMTFSYWLVFFTASCLSNLIGLNISSAFNSIITIYILIPFIIIPQLLFSGVLVNFDKLHRSNFSSYEFVPVIGDLMPARWSFEALVTEQFKSNKYEEKFFRFNMEESQNNWYASFLTDALKKDLWECRYYKDSIKHKGTVANNFAKLNYYFDYLSKLADFGTVPNDLKASLTEEHFNSSVEAAAVMYLDSLSRAFRRLSNNARALKDSIVKITDKEELIYLRNNYYNRSLADLVLDRTTVKKTLETDTRIIQKYEPVYMRPVSKYGRAHFYAPYKQIGNFKADTFWFNTAVLWMISLFLYIALYFKLLQKLIAYFENPGIKKTVEGKIR